MRLFDAMLCCGFLVLSGACTKDTPDATDTDSNTDTGPSAQEELCADYPDNIACPTLPAPPQLEDGTDFSEWEPSQCPSGAMPDFGKPGCIVIGDPCPEGEWPEDLPTENIRYVTPGGTGDGLTKETAAGSIQQMLSGTTSGTTIALSKGRFEEHFEIARRQHVVGACARDTVIAGVDASRRQVVGMTGSGESSLRNVTVTGATVGVWVSNTGAEVSVSGVMIERATIIGFAATNASVAAAEVFIRDTQPLSNGTFGRGMEVGDGAQLSFTRGLVSGNREMGVVVASAGAIATFEDVVIEDTQEEASDGSDGGGLGIQEGATVNFTRGLVSGNRDVGVIVRSESIATFEDVVIEDTQPQASDGSDGWGLEVNTGAQLSFTRGLVSGNRDLGVIVASAGTIATFEDVVIEDTKEIASDGSGGRGLHIQEGASVSFTRGLVSGNRYVGVLVGSESIATFADVVIEDTQEQASDGSGGRGLEVGERAQLSFTRGLVSGNRDVGVFVASAGTIATFADVVIEDTQEQASDGSGGRGLEVGEGAQLSFTRGLVSGNRDVGVLVGQAGTIATFEDVVIKDTQSQVSDGSLGRGLNVQEGASVSFTRGLVSGNRDVGVLVGQAGTIATFEDVVIEDTQSQASDGSGGRGLAIQEGASVSFTRGLVSGNREMGIFLGCQDTSLQLMESVVTGTKVELCAEDPALTCPNAAAQGFGDGILVMGGAYLELQDFEISDNARVGLYLYDTAGTGIDTVAGITGAPTLDVLRGTITGNQYGINFRQGNITPSDFAGKEVACYDNAATVDGCYSEVELEVPDPTAALGGLGK